MPNAALLLQVLLLVSADRRGSNPDQRQIAVLESGEGSGPGR